MKLESPPDEFKAIMAYLAAAVGKAPDKYTVQVYWDLLRDIPADTLAKAAKAAAAEHRYATFPPVALLRELSAKLTGRVSQMTAMEALHGVRRLVNRYGGEYATAEDRQAACAQMPATVAKCLQAFGWDRFCQSENPETLQAQWRMNWDQVSNRENKTAALPEDVRQAISGTRPAIPQDLFRLPAHAMEAKE